MAISRNEVLMGRDAQFPLTPELESNLARLLLALNKFRLFYAIPMLVTSGYRPGHYNEDAGGAANSPHITCEACDFADKTGEIKTWVLKHPSILEECGLYMEDPAHTDGWIHLQIRPVPSGKRIFIP